MKASKHDLVQITNPEHHWFPCVLVVDEVKSYGVMACVLVPTDNAGNVSRAYINLVEADYEVVGQAVIVAGDPTD